jgi:hypothetical protein
MTVYSVCRATGTKITDSNNNQLLILRPNSLNESFTDLQRSRDALNRESCTSLK